LFSLGDFTAVNVSTKCRIFSNKKDHKHAPIMLQTLTENHRAH